MTQISVMGLITSGSHQVFAVYLAGAKQMNSCPQPRRKERDFSGRWVHGVPGAPALLASPPAPLTPFFTQLASAPTRLLSCECWGSDTEV